MRKEVAWTIRPPTMVRSTWRSLISSSGQVRGLPSRCIGVPKRILSPSPPKLNPENALWTPQSHLPAAAAGHSGSQQGVARLWAVWTCRSGWVKLWTHGFPDSRASERPGKAGGERFQTGFHCCKRANYAVAARTALMSSHWRGLRRTRISLGGGGLGQWEVERTPA